MSAMNDQADQGGDQPSGKRGEAAWKETRERIAERNARARKAGIAQREAYEREKETARRVRERQQMAALRGKSGSP